MSDAMMQITDEEAIRRTIQQYVDGGISGRGADMKPAFHDQATIFHPRDHWTSEHS